MKTYSTEFKVKIWENDKIVKLETFNTRQEVETFLEAEGNPCLKYETPEKNYYTLET